MTTFEVNGTRDDIRRRFQVEDLQQFRNSDNLPYAIVGHNLRDKLITDSWIGSFDSEDDFRQVLEFICARFETGNYHFWLADLRHLNAGFSHSQDWLAEVVFPRVVAAGMVREAVVLPAYKGAPKEFDVFGAASAALAKISDGRTRGFQDIDKAKAWLYDGE